MPNNSHYLRNLNAILSKVMGLTGRALTGLGMNSWANINPIFFQNWFMSYLNFADL